MNLREMKQQTDPFRQFNESKGLAPRTISNYSKALRYFCDWFSDEHGHQEKVTARSIRGFLAAKRKEGKAASTLRAYYAALRVFFSFLVSDEVLGEDENPMRLVERPRGKPAEIHPLTPQEVRRLLDSFDKEHSLTEYRDYTMVSLMLDSGLRRYEVVSLRLEQVDLAERRIRVVGKGGKGRTVRIGHLMSQILHNYITNIRPWFANGKGGLFPPVRSKREHIAPDYVSTLVKKKMDEAGIARCNSSCHRLRHTFAASYLRNGGQVFALKELLGHADLAMTERYVTLSQTDLAQDHARASPLDHF